MIITNTSHSKRAVKSNIVYISVKNRKYNIECLQPLIDTVACTYNLVLECKITPYGIHITEHTWSAFSGGDFNKYEIYEPDATIKRMLGDLLRVPRNALHYTRQLPNIID